MRFILKKKSIIVLLLTLILIILLVYTYKKISEKSISEIPVIDYRRELKIIDNKPILEFENFNFLKKF